MTLTQACEIIEELAADCGRSSLTPSIVDTLIYMGSHLDEFSENEVRAYRMFMAAGRKLFCTKETV